VDSEGFSQVVIVPYQEFPLSGDVACNLEEEEEGEGLWRRRRVKGCGGGGGGVVESVRCGTGKRE